MLACLSSLWQATKPTNLKAGHVGFQGGLLRSKSDRFLVSNQCQRGKVLKWGKGANAVNSEAIIRAAKLPTYLPTRWRWEVGGGRAAVQHPARVRHRLSPAALVLAWWAASQRGHGLDRSLIVMVLELLGVAVLRPCIGRRSTSSAGSSHRSTGPQVFAASSVHCSGSCIQVKVRCRSTSKTCRRPWHARDEKAWRRGRAGRPIAANVAGRLVRLDSLEIRSQAPRAPVLAPAATIRSGPSG